MPADSGQQGGSVIKYRERAALAADAMRAAIIAVEALEPDVELTNIVVRLSDDRMKLCRLFDLPPEQAHQAGWLADHG